MLADDTSELLIPRLFQPADSRLPAAPEADPGPGTPVRRAPPTESDDQPNGANTKALSCRARYSGAHSRPNAALACFAAEPIRVVRLAGARNDRFHALTHGTRSRRDLHLRHMMGHTGSPGRKNTHMSKVQAAPCQCCLQLDMFTTLLFAI